MLPPIIVGNVYYNVLFVLELTPAAADLFNRKAKTEIFRLFDRLSIVKWLLSIRHVCLSQTPVDYQHNSTQLKFNKNGSLKG